MRTSFTLPSFAKINCTLRILGKREDGFHELFTVFQTVSLRDFLTFRPSDRLKMTCNLRYMPTDGRNLVLRAAEELRGRYGIKTGASVYLEKRIPSPGGLGGGSSNAAVALLGFARLWNIDVDLQNLNEIAASLGADVPFFLQGGTAIGTGNGTSIESIEDLDKGLLLVVTPKVRVSTSRAFQWLDAPTLTNADVNRILPVCRTEAKSLDLLTSALINDFEASVFAAFPEIRRVKETLLELGAVNAAMSGSGASVFAIFDKIETRQTAIKALDHESTWRKFAVATVSRSEYHDALRR
jgi:4-diphosphocytidyl-2-C-methyl-D-erythritol kinase